MELLVSHSNFEYSNSREETIKFYVSANYEVKLNSGIELLRYKSFSGISIYNIQNENIETPILFNNRLKYVLAIYKQDNNWEENLKYNCHYYSFYQKKGYWLNDIISFLEVNRAKYKITDYIDNSEIIENDIILFKNDPGVIIHSCRFNGKEFIHKCGARGVHKFKTLNGWKDCNICDYGETSNYEICRQINQNKK